MGEGAKVLAKKPKAKSKGLVSKTRETERSQPANSSCEQILFLQESIGNQAVQRLFKTGTIQTKLRTGKPGDVYEREADRLAKRVMRMAEPQLQQQTKEEEPIQPLPEQTTSPIQRWPRNEGAPQAKDSPGQSSEVASDVQKHIDSARGGGRPLSESTRAYFEPRFGHDFSQVRTHSDSRAATTSHQLNARAFTHGQDVFFGSGKYQPETTSGKHLLAHELTHVIQQRAASVMTSSNLVQPVSTVHSNTTNSIYRQSNTTETATPAKPTDDIAPGVMELKGKAQVEPSDSIATWLSARESKTGKANVRFGSIAKGTIDVEKSGEKYKMKKEQAIPLSHPLFKRIGESASSLAPSLIIYTQNDKIMGYIGLQASARNTNALVTQLQKTPELIGLVGFDFGKSLPIINKLEGGKLSVGLTGVPITLGGVFSGNITLEADDEKIKSFTGSANVNVSQLASVNMELNRSEDGLITGSVAADVQLPKNFSGSVNVHWNGQAITGEGTVGYQGEKLSGEVTLKVMEAAEAKKLETTKKAPPKEGAAAPESTKATAKRAKQKLVLFGEGNLTFAFTDWLSGTAHVIVDPKGFVTIIGKITPQKEFELFPQKDYNKKLFKIEARASYGIPVVGNIFIFANVGMDAFAKLGPAKFYKMVVEGTYSTDPEKCKDFSIQGSLNISAAAGLRLRGEAGAGLEILAHDIKAGAGINALAGIRGYAEATPKIGYREKRAAEGDDKKGEFFIRGDLEIAAQPFLGLSGDLFVEIDAPWWSPCPDKKWTWPLGGKEWPIGGSFGVNATVDYVFGSGKVPSIEFKPVDFSADKFLTDLYSDKAAKKSGGDKEKKGAWKEKNTKDAAPPKAAKKGDGQVGKPPELPPAKSKVKPGGPKKPAKPVSPNAKTAEGKTVKELEKEATKKGKKPEPKGPKKETTKEETTKTKDTDKSSKEVKEKAINDLVALRKRNFETISDLDAAVDAVYGKYKPQGLKRIRLDVVGEASSAKLKFIVSASKNKESEQIPLDQLFDDLDELFEDLDELREKQLSKASQTTHAVLAVNGQEKVKTSSSSSGHAEAKIVGPPEHDEWKNATKDARDKVQRPEPEQKSTRIAIALNRSPCGGEEGCSKKLSNALNRFWSKCSGFIDAAREHITFFLSMLGLYKPGKKAREKGIKETTTNDLSELKAAHWKLNVHKPSGSEEHTRRGKELIDRIEDIKSG